MAPARSIATKARQALKATPVGLPYQSYANDPVGFSGAVLGLPLWSHQRRALEAVRDHRRVCWRSCHGSGKTTAIAALVWWYLETRPAAMVIVTAPSFRQVKSVDWRTIYTLRRAAKRPLSGSWSIDPETGCVFEDGRLLIGFAAGSGERFAGFHAKNILVIVDEASGVAPEIFQSLKGALTGDSRLLLCGNPTQPTGEFYDAFSASRASVWHQLHTSYVDVPNVSGEEPAIEGLIDRTLVEEFAADYGAESSAYAVRVLGNFPVDADDTVIGLALVELARSRYEGEETFNKSTDPLVVGVDPARMGDDESVIVVRRGLHILPPIVFRKLDTTQLSERVIGIVASHRRANEQPSVRVDSIGLGAGVCDTLRRLSRDMKIVDVNVASSARRETYLNLRAQGWFQIKDWLKAGGVLPPDRKLEGELATVKYKFTVGASKIQVEPKDDLRRRLGRSPDRADALMLATFDSVISTGGTFSEDYWNPMNVDDDRRLLDDLEFDFNKTRVERGLDY